MALLGGSAIPRYRCVHIRCHAQTVGVHDPQVPLGRCMALLGGFAIPYPGFGVVLCDAVAVIVQEGEVVLRLNVTGLGSRAQFSSSVCLRQGYAANTYSNTYEYPAYYCLHTSCPTVLLLK